MTQTNLGRDILDSDKITLYLLFIILINRLLIWYIWKPLSLSELTPILFNIELTDLGLDGFIYSFHTEKDNILFFCFLLLNKVNLEVFDPKWVNSIWNMIGVNSLMLRDLQLIFESEKNWIN